MAIGVVQIVGYLNDFEYAVVNHELVRPTTFCTSIDELVWGKNVNTI